MIDTTSYMIAGLVIVFLGIISYTMSLVIRHRGLANQEQILRENGEYQLSERIEEG